MDKVTFLRFEAPFVIFETPFQTFEKPFQNGNSSSSLEMNGLYPSGKSSEKF